jgi:hypothetical protein
MNYVTANVTMPKEWFNANVDLPATAGAFVTAKDGEWEINVRYINFPGWYVFNLKPEYKRDVYALIEQKCIQKYADEKLKQEDYVL